MLQNASFEALDLKIFQGSRPRTPLEHIRGCFASCVKYKFLKKISAQPPLPPPAVSQFLDPPLKPTQDVATSVSVYKSLRPNARYSLGYIYKCIAVEFFHPLPDTQLRYSLQWQCVWTKATDFLSASQILHVISVGWLSSSYPRS